RPWCNAARDSYPYLVHSGNAGSLTKQYDLGHATADRDLWRNHTFITQARAIDVQDLSGNGGIGGGGDVRRPCVKDGSLPLPIAGKRHKRRRRHQHVWIVEFRAGEYSEPQHIWIVGSSIGGASGDQHSAIVEKRGRVGFARRSHAARRDKGPR